MNCYIDEKNHRKFDGKPVPTSFESWAFYLIISSIRLNMSSLIVCRILASNYQANNHYNRAGARCPIFLVMSFLIRDIFRSHDFFVNFCHAICGYILILARSIEGGFGTSFSKLYEVVHNYWCCVLIIISCSTLHKLTFYLSEIYWHQFFFLIKYKSIKKIMTSNLLFKKVP